VEVHALPGWQPHPDVWLLLGLTLAGYWLAIARLGPRHAPAGRPAVSPLQAVSFTTGALALFVVSAWPIHDVAEQHLFSAHMIQHMVEMMVAPPLLLLGTPAWLARLVLSRGPALQVVRWTARLVPALVLFNAALVFAHSPFVMEWQLGSGVTHFAVHVAITAAALFAWLPVASPLPEVPRFSPPLRMLFLFLLGVVPTVPASFLTFGDRPLYGVYEDLPRLWGISALDDMRVGGLLMKIAGGVILWVIIAVVFFRWYAEEEDRHLPKQVSRDIDRELAQMGLANR
jgi:putative membrane protein